MTVLLWPTVWEGNTASSRYFVPGVVSLTIGIIQDSQTGHTAG
jgi:hypothetical protein